MKTQKGFIVPLLLILIAIVVVGGGFYVYHENKQPAESSEATTTVDIQVDNTEHTVKTEGGIKGYVSIGPTCPVINDNDVANTCADKPYQTTFEVMKDNQIVKSFQSDVNGNYSVTLPQGQYEIISANSIQANPAILPKMISPGLINVNDSSYTTVNISFDSGIR